MIHKIIKYESLDKLNKTIIENKFLNYEETLIQIFTGMKNEDIKYLIDKLHLLLPNAKIIGSSAYNGIISDEITLGETIISFSCFEQTKIQSILVDTENMSMYNVGIQIAKELIKNDTKLLLVFSHGDYSHKNYDVNDLMNGINFVNSEIIVAGGAASSSSKPFTTIDSQGINFDTFVFNEKIVKENGIVAAALSSKELRVTSGFNLGWKTIGREMKVTKCEKNKWLSRVYTIDNIPVLDLYEKYFGKELSKELLSSVLTLSFVIKRNGVEIDATPIRIFKDKSISYTAEIDEGDSIWFGYGDISIIIEEAAKKAKEIAQKRQEALFIYSCISRPATLGNYAKNELIPFSSIAPTCGFCTNREFSTFKSKYMTFGKTLSFIGLSESKTESSYTPSIIKSDENLTVQMKTSRGTYNMIQTVTAELEEDNKILSTLVEINSKILDYENLKSFLEYILNKAIKIIKVANHGAFFFLNDQNQLELVSLVGYDEYAKEKLKNFKLNLCDSLIWIETDGKLDKAIVVNDINDYKKNYSKSEVVPELEETQFLLTKMIIVPIRIDNKFYGYITVDCPSSESFGYKDMKLMDFFAEGIAIVIKNKLLFDKTMILSKYDALTGATNRGYFEIIVKEHMKNIELTKERFSIAVFDINFLKKANDTHGHDVGDSLLKDFVNIVSENIRKSDVFARFGGDEFALALFNVDEKIAMIKIKLLEKKVDEFNERHKEKPYKISYSVGIANYPLEGLTLDELIKIADERMYENKKLSRR